MSTVVSNLELSESHTRSTRPLVGLRSSHGDVSDLTQLTLTMSAGEIKTIDASRFLYLHMRETFAISFAYVSSTGVVGPAISIPEIEGSMALPFAVQMVITAPATTTLPHVVTAVYA